MTIWLLGHDHTPLHVSLCRTALLPSSSWIRPFLLFVDYKREDDVRMLSMVCKQLLSKASTSPGMMLDPPA